MSKPISQREARRLKQRVRQMEADRAAERSRWTKDYPGGVLIDTVVVTNTEYNIVRTALLMGHPVVVTCHSEVNKLGVWGMKS